MPTLALAKKALAAISTDVGQLHAADVRSPARRPACRTRHRPASASCVACGRTTFSPRHRTARFLGVDQAVEGRELLARDAFAGVEHRGEGLARMFGEAPRLHSASTSSQSWSRKSTLSLMSGAIGPVELHSTSNTPAAPMPPPMHIVTHDLLGAAALAFDQRMAGQALAADAVGVADGDGAAVDVQPVHRDAQRVGAVQHLHGEGFVELPQVDVAHRQAQALEHLGHGEHRADAHLVGLAAGHRKAEEAAQRLQARAARHRLSSTTTQAPAPSLNWLALPAVITPPGQRRADAAGCPRPWCRGAGLRRR